MLPILMLTLAAPAHADAPYMWGVGPELGTIVLPFQHPVAFPNLDVDNDGDGKNDKISDSLEKTGGDGLIGARGALYINGKSRLVGQGGFGFGGGGYGSAEFTGEYQVIPVSGSGVDAFLGAGLGFGSMRWRTWCGTDGSAISADCAITNPGTFKMSTLLLRAEVGALYRNKTQAYELSLWGHYVVAGNRKFLPQASDAEEAVTSVGIYPYLGVAGTVYFGDFRPPGKKGNKKGKKNADG